MKKSILLPLFAIFLLCNLSLNAQSNIEIQCTMSLEAITQVQPYDVDHPKQEETMELATTLISELNLVYDKVNNYILLGLAENLEAIQIAVDAAKLLGMNYSMFDADLEFIETLK
jgi:hypothetical protein|tara:strand:- start:138 stop:482 length:345 start_codon:yes stop_codon:yes gene_type:complete